MSRVAQLAVAAAVYAIDRPYSYRVPEDMPLAVGMRVLVPFGHGNRRTEGIVLSVQEGVAAGLKAVEQMLDDASILTGGQLRLAAFMKERYFCTFYDAVKAILPAGLWFDEKRTLMLVSGAQDKLPPGMANSGAARLVQLLTDLGGSAPERTLRQQFESPQAFDAAVQALRKRRLLRADASLTQKASEKTIKVAALAVSAEEAEQFAAKKQFSAPLQAALLRLLCTVGAGPCRELCELTGASMQTVSRLAKLGLIETYEQEQLRSPKREDIPPAGPLTLNTEQQIAFDGLNRQMTQEKPGAALLYGVTGSGKTSVYLALIRSALDAGRSAMLLVPEIALTAQLVDRLRQVFGERVIAYHSKLTDRKRTELYLRLRDSAGGELVIGARSAIFLPLRRLELVVVDEEHDPSYKQTDPAPRYQARDCAVLMTRLLGCRTLLGSATPSLESYLNAATGKYGSVVLAERYGPSRMPQILVSDTIRAVKRGERHAHFNKLLLDRMEETLGGGGQAMLFQNRRGFAPYVECRECGWTARCPDCNVTLTLHKGSGRMVCHYCGHTEPVPAKCPHCRVTEPVPMGFGTEKVEEEIARVFPEARVARLDRDSVTSERAFRQIVEAFARGDDDILVGTQMITKGFDFGGVELVGVLNADNLLNNPDFRSAERAFQLLMQVAGRAGRRENPGTVVIQTAEPGHPVLQQVIAGDYEAMARQQLAERKAFFYPPYARLLNLLLRHRDPVTLRRAANALAAALRERFGRRVLGPTAPPVDRVRGEYLATLLLKVEAGASLARAREAVRGILDRVVKSPECKGVTILCDVDPQ